MTAMKLVFVVVSLVVVVLASTFEESRDLEDFCPWCPKWVKCNFTETKGASCQDCKTKLVCTPVGGIQIKCFWPGKEHCVAGDCAAQPSQECATTTTEPPAPTTPEPTVTSPPTQDIEY